MTVSLKHEISFGQIIVASTFVVMLTVQGVAWAWHEASQTKDISQLQTDIGRHGGAFAHTGALTKMADFDGRLNVMKTEMRTTNQHLSEIKLDIREIVKLRRLGLPANDR